MQSQGKQGLDEYEAEAKAYTDYIISNMGHHDGSTDLARATFSEENWSYMANISEEDMAYEEELFESVFSKIPANLELTSSD